MKVLELFAGIGACSKALERLGFNVEIVDAVEIDKYAIASFNAIHNTNFEVQDITTWNKDLKDIDLITHGSPCQDFSVAGKQAGGDINSGTRSSLMYETIRIVGKLRPKYVLWENVKNLLSKKHKHNFDAYIEAMNILGYNSYYEVLNAKDYGIPQNRERVYTISIRRNVDKFNFLFPKKEELKLRLKDMLEDEVEEKYYLSNAQIERIKASTYNVSKTRIQEKDYCDTLCARDWKDPKCVQVGKLDIKGQDIIKRVYSDKGISPTLTDMQGGNRQPKIITHIIPQTVKVRKYPVNIPLLQNYLRNRKHNLGMSNKEIAEKLEVPITTVEHWFRKDSCFSIPEPDIWYRLKEVLCFNLDIFDESIMTFEEREGVYEKADRVYDEKGLAPTLTQQEEKILIKNATKKGYDEAVDGDSVNLQYPDSNTRRGRVGHQVSQTLMANDNIGVVEGIKVIGNYMPSGHDASRIVDSNGLAPTIKENHGTITATIIKPKLINNNKRLKRLVDKTEFREGKVLNMDLYNQTTNENISQCLTEPHHNTQRLFDGYRIRKLTPKECWRLMGFDDEDFEKAKNIPMSNTQLYKQARKFNLRISIRKNI